MHSEWVEGQSGGSGIVEMELKGPGFSYLSCNGMFLETTAGLQRVVKQCAGVKEKGAGIGANAANCFQQFFGMNLRQILSPNRITLSGRDG